MDKLKEKVGTILSRKFRGAAVELKRTRPGHRIVGSLIWKGFDGKDQLDRQTALRTAIDSALPSEDRSRVSFILTLTPFEKEWMSEKNDIEYVPKKSRRK